ncbi:helix-turn-helix transcriptional regulator [Mucilaginibacter sp. JRF]|uniref:helix-turn-helix domain-containing protein n=1 Tax=Mucilaginibacter sp. JRF TaxID=2780088 RepID=UPI0018800F29|nr:helix-turn-helix transcriptional regulator [Mucilaginibacter sp. JRF]MBE9583289.1 helix-turn-helix transcriptional regulator [Mucilaginibacter sp. JRF]
MDTKTLDDFYKEASAFLNADLSKILPDGIDKEVGHFNVIDIAAVLKILKVRPTAKMTYNRRAYYKISLVQGRNRAEYADKVIEIEDQALMFASPKVPYHWFPVDDEADRGGFFCLFTAEFLAKSKSGIVLDDLPIFKPGGFPCFHLSEQDKDEIAVIFRKMHKEMRSDYAFKYDLIRNYLMELIHYGQKLQPATDLYREHNASGRVFSLFNELLERQFPISSPLQSLKLRTAQDYANQLSIHVNYLNRVLKEQTGNTTKNLISNRIVQEAKIMLKQTDWNISQIAHSLGFEEVAHFSNFFKKQTDSSPLTFRH